MKSVDPGLLRKMLRYDPETGHLFWKNRTFDMFTDGGHTAEHTCAKWNSRYGETQAFTTIDRKGYPMGAIFNHTYRAHRVIWAIVYGEWPPDQIDHINGIRTDNRIANLRRATNSQNSRNRGAQSNNRTGYKGVFYDNRVKKYVAILVVDGKQHRGGCFLSVEDAAAAYANLCREHHGEFSRLN